MFQLLHTFLFIANSYELLVNRKRNIDIPDEDYDNVMFISMGYFIYDNFGKPFTVYTVHHAISIASLFLLRIPELRGVFLYGMLVMEISNIPLYLAYGARHTNVNNADLINTLDIITFYVYVTCRVFLYALVFTQSVIYTPLYMSIALLWFIPNIMWAKKLYDGLKKSHLI